MSEVDKPDWQDNAPTKPKSVLGGDVDGVSSFIDGQKGAQKFQDKVAGTLGSTMGADLGSSINRTTATTPKSLTDWGNIQTMCQSLMAIGKKIMGEAEDLASDASNEPVISPTELVGQFVDVILALLPPLEDLLQLVTGNEQAMQGSADMWMAVVDGAGQTGDYIKEVGEAALDGWEGEASDKARTRIEEVGNAVSVTGMWGYAVGIGLAAYALLAKYLFAKLKEFISGQIWHFISKDVPTLVGSAGIATPAVAASRAAQIAIKVIDAITLIQAAITIFELGSELFDMIKDIGGLIGEATGFLSSEA
ncbi:hypothetical protein [Haloglycomyces albus]|uniref:hypothetical protein n=1 Tax=Haloglycomyces albus TaxID=526067 RepID=UPI00046CB888|nr:hypothetical protein [Haloglycomyces albus]